VVLGFPPQYPSKPLPLTVIETLLNGNPDPDRRKGRGSPDLVDPGSIPCLPLHEGFHHLNACPLTDVKRVKRSYLHGNIRMRTGSSLDTGEMGRPSGGVHRMEGINSFYAPVRIEFVQQASSHVTAEVG
jgi:hypothetical protein